jgi:ATP-dependent DNA helicase RecQ
MDEETVMLFGALFQLRKDQAQQRKIAPYMIFSETVLGLLAKHRPADETHFSLIEGIDEQKAKDYGAVFTKTIAQFCLAHKLQTNVFDTNTLDKRYFISLFGKVPELI